MKKIFFINYRNLYYNPDYIIIFEFNLNIHNLKDLKETKITFESKKHSNDYYLNLIFETKKYEIYFLNDKELAEETEINLVQLIKKVKF